MASTPRICGSATNRSLNSGLLRTSVAMVFRISSTLLGSAEKSTLTLMVATEKSALWLATVVICELGMTYSVPSPPRTGGFAEGHGLDGSREAGHGDHVAHVELVFDEDQGAVQHVLHDVLRGQADGYAGDAGRGQQRRQVHSDGSQKLHAHDGADDGEPGGADYARERFHLGDTGYADGVTLGEANHVVGDEAEQAAENQSDDGNHDQVGQLDAYEFLNVDEPFVQHLAHESPFGKETGSHRKQK